MLCCSFLVFFFFFFFLLRDAHFGMDSNSESNVCVRLLLLLLSIFSVPQPPSILDAPMVTMDGVLDPTYFIGKFQPEVLQRLIAAPQPTEPIHEEFDEEEAHDGNRKATERAALEWDTRPGRTTVRRRRKSQTMTQLQDIWSGTLSPGTLTTESFLRELHKVRRKNQTTADAVMESIFAELRKLKDAAEQQKLEETEKEFQEVYREFAARQSTLQPELSHRNPEMNSEFARASPRLRRLWKRLQPEDLGRMVGYMGQLGFPLHHLTYTPAVYRVSTSNPSAYFPSYSPAAAAAAADGMISGGAQDASAEKTGAGTEGTNGEPEQDGAEEMELFSAV